MLVSKTKRNINYLFEKAVGYIIKRRVDAFYDSKEEEQDLQYLIKNWIKIIPKNIDSYLVFLLKKNRKEITEDLEKFNFDGKSANKIEDEYRGYLYYKKYIRKQNEKQDPKIYGGC